MRPDTNSPETTLAQAWDLCVLPDAEWHPEAEGLAVLLDHDAPNGARDLAWLARPADLRRLLERACEDPIPPCPSAGIGCAATAGGEVVCAGVDGPVSSPLPPDLYTELRSDWRRLCGLGTGRIVCALGADEREVYTGEFQSFSLADDHDDPVGLRFGCVVEAAIEREIVPGSDYVAVRGNCGLREDGTARCGNPASAPCGPVEDLVDMVDWRCSIGRDGALACIVQEQPREVPASFVPAPAGRFTAVAGNSSIGLICAVSEAGALTCWAPTPFDALDAFLATISTL